MKMIQGSKRSSRAPSETLVYVSVERLEEEYEAGKEAQRLDEHLRKQMRIVSSFGITMLAIICSSLGYGGQSSAYIALLLNFLVQVLL
jgi:hypothetical protein